MSGAAELRRSGGAAAGVLTALAMALPGCGGGDRFPSGTYDTRIAGSRSELDGDWSLTFGPAGDYRVSRDGQLAMAGRYARDAGEITVTDESGPLKCPPGLTTGRYRWQSRGPGLSLSPLDDACAGRRALLTRQPFTRRNGP